jgi:hypothetical protein
MYPGNATSNEWVPDYMNRFIEYSALGTEISCNNLTVTIKLRNFEQ